MLHFKEKANLMERLILKMNKAEHIQSINTLSFNLITLTKPQQEIIDIIVQRPKSRPLFCLQQTTETEMSKAT